MGTSKQDNEEGCVLCFSEKMEYRTIITESVLQKCKALSNLT